jgi:hypothetical protein
MFQQLKYVLGAVSWMSINSTFCFLLWSFLFLYFKANVMSFFFALFYFITFHIGESYTTLKCFKPGQHLNFLTNPLYLGLVMSREK